ncbi:MAG: hypothetical protein HQL52_02035 [Magnetococcales bacterium]|nr:hypothetical protein [Magnetococcales bacterium]
MKRLRLWPLLGIVLLISACSGNIPVPWEDNLLDPARVPTREPLDIPPDLDQLPASTQGEGSSENWVNPDNDGTPAKSAGTILFDSPDSGEAAPLDRDEQERLPDWMVNP